MTKKLDRDARRMIRARREQELAATLGMNEVEVRSVIANIADPDKRPNHMSAADGKKGERHEDAK